MVTQFFVVVFLGSSVFLLAGGFSLFDHPDRQLIIQRFENCKGTRLPMEWNDAKVTFDKATKQKVLNLNLIIKEEVTTKFLMTFSFLKCDTSGNPDSCEYMFKDQKIERICKFLPMKDQSWSLFISYFDKEFNCPLKPDTYRLIDLPINSSALNKFPIKDAVWKIHVEGFDKEKKNSCVDAQIKVITPRGKSG